MRKNRWVWALLMLLMALVIRFWPQNYQLMLLRSFAFQALIVFILVSIYWFYRGRMLNAVLGVCSVFIVNSFLPPVLTDVEGSLHADSLPIGQKGGVVIAHFNVLKKNIDHGSTIAQAINSDADLISFQEVDRKWADELSESLHCKYPYSKIVARSNNYGIAVFSKTPFNKVKVFYSGGDPSIEGRVNVNGKEIHFIAIHARSPMPRYNYVLRNEQLLEVGERMGDANGPKLLIGDLNAVPWDEKVVRLRRDTGLKDSRTSIASTYPSYGGFASIPIDHILHSTDLKCLGFKTISGMSSDHLGVIGVYQFEENRAENG